MFVRISISNLEYDEEKQYTEEKKLHVLEVLPWSDEGR